MCLQFLKDKSILYKEKFNTAALSHIKAGGVASVIAYPRDENELVYIIREAARRDIRYKVIGGCSNTYFCDEGFSGIIISTRLLNSLNISGATISLTAGCILSSAIKRAFSSGIAFAPSLLGIPGTVGGALRNNAGALGTEISDYFINGRFFSLQEDKILILSKEDLHFSYRRSLISSNSIVFLGGEFLGASYTENECISRMNAAIEYRRERHPKLPSLGSFFKRSGDIIPAALIEKAGLKGKRIGDAMVSEVHSGFIVNLGAATASEVSGLAAEVANEVFKKFGVLLEKEAEQVE